MLAGLAGSLGSVRPGVRVVRCPRCSLWQMVQ